MTFPQIVVGTYEEFVLGYNPQYKDENNTKCKLHQSFATHSHQASVRCVAAHGHLMASSGADEYINIYDMVVMEVSTVINYHNSTVTCLEFTPDGSHLVTGNQNGDIAIFRCKDWTLMKLWKEAHKHANGVTSISLHPSGSLLLTTGADSIVRFWNLIKGRQAYAKNFSKKCSISNSLNFGLWSKDGSFYSVGIGSTLEVYKTETATLVYEIKTNSRITHSIFVKKNLICLSMENGSIEIHSITKRKLKLKKQGHQNRVKSLSSFDIQVCKNNKPLFKSYIVSTDSKGGIKLWHLKKKQLNFMLLLRGEAYCGCRITCMTMVSCKDIKTETNGSSDLVNQNNISKEAVTDNNNGEMNIRSNCKEPKLVSKEQKKFKQKRKNTEEISKLELEQQNSKKFKNSLLAKNDKKNLSSFNKAL